MRRNLGEKLLESLRSVLPITVIVLVFSISLTPLGTGVMTLFVFGALMLIGGIGLFTLRRSRTSGFWPIRSLPSPTSC